MQRNKRKITPKRNSQTYTVLRGNSPWQIANDHGITLDEFYKLNPWVKGKQNGVIHPGNVVRVSKEEPTYSPRMSVDLLRGVTVTAKRINKPTVNSKQKPKTQQTQPIKKTTAPKSNPQKKLSEPSLVDTAKTEAVNAFNRLRNKAASTIRDSEYLKDVDAANDVADILSQPTIQGMLDNLEAGISLRGLLAKEKIKSLFENEEDYADYSYQKPKKEVRPKISSKDLAYLPNGKYGLMDNRVDYNGHSFKLSELNPENPIENIVTDTTGIYRSAFADNPDKFKSGTVVNLSRTPLGFRNRYHKYNNSGKPASKENLDPIHRTAGIIGSSYTPFLRYGHPALLSKDGDYGFGKYNWNYYYGIDDNGRFVAGNDYKSLPRNASYARTIGHKVTGLEAPLLGESAILHNYNRPDSRINLTSATREIDKTNRGGAYLIGGNDTISVEGTAALVDRYIQLLKLRNQIPYVWYVEQDAGSYSEHPKSRSGEFTPQEVGKWFHLNPLRTAGNAVYINRPTITE